MTRFLLPALLTTCALALAACQPAPKGIDPNVLSDTIGEVVGDPSTCVLLVEKDTAKVVWRYGTFAACARPLPACNTTGSLTADDLAKMAARGDRRTASCDSQADGTRTVSWASGAAPKRADAKHGDLAYAVVMEGKSENSLPGREIQARIEPAFSRAGL